MILGLIGEFFKWPGFRIFTRIAYAVYLVQFPVYFYNVGTAKSATYFTTQVLVIKNIKIFSVAHHAHLQRKSLM